MKRRAAWLVAVLVLSSAACDESAEPLAKPGERIDQAVLGDWDCAPVDQPAEPPEKPLRRRASGVELHPQFAS